jgi:hypothetical protein
MIPAVLRHVVHSARLFAAASTLAFATARAQSTPAPAHDAAVHSQFGAINGIVIDSLHGRPLDGAQVSVEGLNSSAITDSAGRFRIDSVPPGKYRIGVFHPLLDSLALSIASPPLQVFADSTLAVTVGTPSAVSFIRLACGPIQIDTIAGIGPSVVVGRVLDAETDAPAAGIRVTLTWAEMQAGTNVGLHRIQRTRDTTTGPSGGFRFCNLPPGVNGVARAIIPTADSNAVSRPLALNGRLVTALVLHVPGAPNAASSSHGTASSGEGTAASQGSVLTGRVVRSDSAGPLSGAQVTVLGSRITAVTNDSGEFTLRGLPPGSRTLAVRAVGWQPVTMAVDLAVHEPRQVIVPLQVRTAELQAVVVTATLNTGLKRVGFDERKHMGIGHFIGPDDIERRGSFEFVDLLSGTPGVVRRPGPFGEDYLAGTRGVSGCVAYIVDGVPYTEMTHGDINTFVRAEEVGAVEVYQAAEGQVQPMVISEVTIMNVGGSGRRMGTMDGNAARGSGIGRSGGQGGGSGCVRIVVWTKARLGLGSGAGH